MTRRLAPLATALLLLAAAPGRTAEAATGDDPLSTAGGAITLRVVVGAKDKEPTVWAGTLALSAGRIVATDGLRFAGDDFVAAERFSVETRRTYPILWQRQKKDPSEFPMEPNGFVLTVAGHGAGATLELASSHGNASIPLGGLGYGAAKPFLEGAVTVQRVPNYRLLVTDPTEDAYPAVACAPDGTLTVVYTAFTHGDAFRVRTQPQAPPTDFADLGQPTGGDRVMAVECRGGTWSTPVAVSPANGDVSRPAVAVDGSGRAWTVWSAQVGANWDLYAAARTPAGWSAPARITTDPGPDVGPALATDAQGRLCLAWQAFRNGNSDILFARQDGDAFGAPEPIGTGPANEWDPAIAAAADGQVAVAWDTFERGDYDLVVRVRSGDAWRPPRLVAGTVRNECRASLAFDRQGQLWIAYEVSPQGWGKDFGPYDRTPIRTALYQAREVGLKVLAGDRLQVPAGGQDVNTVLPGPGGNQRGPKAPRNNLLAGPRVAVDASGRVWLAARSRLGPYTSQAGGAWVTAMTSLDANGWRAFFLLPCSDGLLHEGSALVPVPDGGLCVVSGADGRTRNAAFFGPNQGKLRRRAPTTPPATSRAPLPEYPDPVSNWNIAAALTGKLADPGAIALEPVADDPPHEPLPEAADEARNIRTVRDYRTTVAGRELRILRGEFHRHTEFSPDGAGDGSVLDMWRYGLDLANHDWMGNGDHDNGNGREFNWWIIQKTSDLYRVPGRFTPMFTYERSCNYPDGHRNVVFAKRGVRTLPRLKAGAGKDMDDQPADAPRPNSPDTQMLYRYLAQWDGICASHTSGTDMGTDWRDNDPRVEPVVEIYQGDRQNYERPDAPRTNSADYSLGGWRPLGFVNRALLKGYRLGFQSSSDHVSTHMSYCCVYAPELTRDAVLDGLKKRHVYGATDNIVAEVRCGDYLMGDEFTVNRPPTLHVKLIGSAPFERVVIVKDDVYVYSVSPNQPTVEFDWTDPNVTAGKTSYYYVRGEQVGDVLEIKVPPSEGSAGTVKASNGELVWASPMWITYKP